MGKLEKISAWNLTKVRSKKEVIDEARASGATVHFASLMDICHLKNAESEAKHRLCLHPFGRQSERSKESLFCPTPGSQIYKMMLVLAAHHGWSVRFFDVSRAFHTNQGSCVCGAT